jgi:Putative bacterial sensory transduction regulator
VTSDAADLVQAALTELDVPFHSPEPGAFLLTLPGERRHRTLVWLLIGDHDLLVESFVCRQPDENSSGVYRYLLQRNAKLRSVAYCLDGVGDIHLVGRVGLAGLTAAELDTVIGVVLSAADADFNPILERGFPSAIRREWAWRSETGQSLRNLQAFRHLIESGS